MPTSFNQIQALTFDVFGTILDLRASLTPSIRKFLDRAGAAIAPERFWSDWRARQRIEQYQDNIVQMGHSGYLTVARRACRYSLLRHGLVAGDSQVDSLMQGWQELTPFADVHPALERLAERYRLAVLSNGEQAYLEHLATNRIGWHFDEIISVETVGAFKPHPGVYRKGAGLLGLEVGECLMISSNSFDLMGARMCGFRGIFVNRDRLPYEDSPYRPNATVADFSELADILL